MFHAKYQVDPIISENPPLALYGTFLSMGFVVLTLSLAGGGQIDPPRHIFICRGNNFNLTYSGFGDFS